MLLFAASVRSIRRILALSLISLLIVTGLAGLQAERAGAAPGKAGRTVITASGSAAQSTFAFTNRKRGKHGAARLKRVARLDRVAAEQARRMARARSMFHNPNLARDLRNWCAYGENVAYAQSVRRANQLLWNSPGHRANMLKRRFDRMGSAVVVDPAGIRWVVQVFGRRC